MATVTQPHPTDASLTGPVTTYGYDLRGNKVAQTDALGRVTRWEYDELGRVTRRILPKAASETRSKRP